MLIVLHFDMPYIKWAKIFIRSIEKNEPKAKIYISAINFNNKSIKYFKTLKNVLEIKQIKLNKVGSKGFHGQRGIWMAQIISIRSAVFLEVIKKYPDEDLYINTDVDMLMINKLDKLRQNMKNNDIGICVNKDKVKGGFVCIKNNKNTRKFIDIWDKTCNGKYIETIDQIGLSKAYVELKDKFKVYNLGFQYLDPFCDKDSYVWSAHKTLYGKKDNRLELFNYVLNHLQNKTKWQLYLEKWKKTYKRRKDVN